MRLKSLLALALAVALCAPTLALAQRRPAGQPAQQGAQPAQAGTPLPRIDYSEFRLPNGLRVILHRDPSTPIVAVNVWYHVGSKNERPGRTGFAHLFEHMMFQGSEHYNDEYFRPIQEAGGTLNGSTNVDRTNYWQVVPSNFLELALWMEADRMGFLLPAMSQEKLTNQINVVQNEKRQNYDNRPYGLVSERIAATMYPPNHPYHWLTIGSLADLRAATMEDVQNFFRRFYTPNNASLVIAGDFDPAQARRWVERYFGPLPRGPEREAINAPQPRLERETRIQMDDRVQLPRLYMVWHTAPHFTPQEAQLDTLAHILAGGKSSRLYRALVYERQIAQEVTAFNFGREIAGQFQIIVTAKPGTTLQDLERAVNEEVARLQQEGPTADEMTRAYNVREANFIYNLQAVGGFGGRSDTLNQYAIYLNNPGYFNEDLARYRRVTAQDVQRAAREYLHDRRLVLTVTPRARGAAPAREPAPASPEAAATPTPAPAAGATQAAAQQPPTGSRPAGAPETPARAEAAATTPAGAAPPTAESGAAQTAPGAQPAQQSAPRSAQDAERFQLPRPGPDPQMQLPRIQRHRLSNGLEVLVVPHREMPVVTMNLVVKTGAAADGRERAGLASLTADMLDEGTRTRNALELSEELAAIGARISTGASWDASGANLLTVARHMDRALELFADVLLNPAFPENELMRVRNTRLVALQQRRDDPNAIASLVYSSLLYGAEHPYGQPLIGTEASVQRMRVEDMRRFYETYFRPNNAALIVVGDVDTRTLLPKLEQAFRGWQRGEVPATNITRPAPRERAGIYLVDRPESAQSVLSIGHVGVERATPDYFPLLVLNTILGGQFVSRVNLNLRENKGYTYGARTVFDYRHGPGPFMASAGVQTAVTRESIIEFMRELRGVRGDIPITAEELAAGKQAIIRGYPRGFETPAQIANRLEDIVLYNLPDDYFNNYIRRVQAVTMQDVARAANRYLDPARMAILVVGDRRVVEPTLREIEGLGSTITILDPEGRIVSGAGQRSNGNPEGGTRRP